MTRKEAELVEPGTLIVYLLDNGEILDTYQVTAPVDDRDHFHCVSMTHGENAYVWYVKHSVLTPAIQLRHDAVRNEQAYNLACGQYDSSVRWFGTKFANQVTINLEDVRRKLPVKATMGYEVSPQAERVTLRLSAAEFDKLMQILNVDARVPDASDFQDACDKNEELAALKAKKDEILVLLREQLSYLREAV